MSWINGCRSALPVGIAILGLLWVSVAATPQDTASDTHGNPDAEAGLPFIRNFSPRELNGTDQVWASAQDRRGVMYFGTGFGVLEYDGVSWRSIRTGGFVRSLAACEDGRVYAGSQSDAGYLAPDSAGKIQFVSLRDKVPGEQRAFGDISSTVCTPEGVYFQSSTHLLRWGGGRMKVWPAPKRFIAFAGYVNGRLYVGERAAGMLQVRGDSLEPVPGFEQFTTARRLFLLPYGDDRILVADHGPTDPGQRYETPFYLYDGKTLTPFRTEADKLLTPERSLYSGAVLADGTFALGTLGGGVIIMGRDGRLIRVADKSSGLRDPSVYSVNTDREGALWLTLSSGVARMEALSPLSSYGPESGLDGNIYSVSRHAGKIYAGTERGVFVLDVRPGGRSRFQRVSGPGMDQAFGFASVQDRGTTSRLVVAAGSGLHEIRDDRASTLKVSGVAESFPARSIAASRRNPGRIYVGVFDGLDILQLRNGVWVDEGRIRITGARVSQIAELEGGELWLGTESSGVVRVTFSQAKAEVKRFGSEQGLPGGAGYVWRAGGRLIFAFGDLSRLYGFDKAAEKFVPDSTFAAAPVDLQEDGLGFAEDSSGNIWTQRGGEMVLMVRKSDGSYVINAHPFLHSTQFGAYNGSFADQHGVMWFAANGGLLRYDPARARPNPLGYSALIRRVNLAGGPALFDGAGAPGSPRLKAANNALRFEFAAPSFGDESATEFRQYLEGLDKGWSGWSKETRRDFTSLPFGAYSFHVRARNAWGQESGEATYSFQILPPWYQTWWAYALYALAFTAALMGGRRHLIARERELARGRTEALEKTVRERTAELAAQKDDLQRAYETAQQRAAELATLNRIGQALASKLDVNSLIQLVGDQVREVFDAGIVHVALLDKAGTLQFRYGRADDSSQIAPGRDLTSRVLQSGQPLLMSEDTTGSYLGVPISVSGDVAGVLSVQHTGLEGRFSADDMRLLGTIAVVVGGALENARLFEEAVAARAAAEEANATKSSFLSTVSHELRTPLTSVIGFAKIVRRRLTERLFPLVPAGDKKAEQAMRQVTENLDIVVSEGERLTKLINDVLDLAKIQAGKIEWHMETLSIDEIIDRAIAATSSLVENKPITLTSEAPAGLPAFTGDRDRMIQVVINLISNAVKFTPEGSVICRARRNGPDLVVSVSDTGVGIAEADQSRVFEKFRQVGDTLTDKPKGTGLGLPICKEIVEYHGGRIWVESKLRSGSVFSFSLPVKPSEPRASGNGGGILVVDDDPKARELVEKEFQEAGRAVRVAATGREALAMVRERKPGLVILDVMMPEMNGFDVAAVLRSNPETMDIPIMMLSIAAETERSHQLGIDKYLTKPIDTKLLFQEVDDLMRNGRSTNNGSAK